MTKIDTADPILSGYVTDSGDETQRNFRYQHSYGVMLLVAGVLQIRSFIAIWCEHHEDILAESSTGAFQAFQVKTRQPELGAWVNNDEDIRKSIKRFVALDQKFGAKISQFHFISNTNCYTCGTDVQHKNLKTSPVRFIEAIKKATKVEKIAEPFLQVFKDLSAYSECTEQELYITLQRTLIKKSPPRESIDSELVTAYLNKIPGCEFLPVTSLNSIRDEVIKLVYDASSMVIDDPLKYLYDPSEDDIDPRVSAKRVSIDKVNQAVSNFKEIIFRYQPHDLKLTLDNTKKNYSILEQKFIVAKLQDQISTMKRRTLTAEHQLLEMAVRAPEEFNKTFTQLQSVVQAECDEASLSVRFPEGTTEEVKDYGPQMLNETIKRFKQIADQQPEKVHNEAYESLVGIAGLLTEDCSVWWSKKFSIVKPK